MKYLFLLYKKTYNDNKYFYYTRRRIMTINIFIIQDNVFLLYVKVYFLLYTRTNILLYIKMYIMLYDKKKY